MGCDIHIHTEVKIAGKWHHMNSGSYPRDYKLFGFIAGVRDYNPSPLAAERGLPDDVSELTQFIADYEGCDAHSNTWLNADEIILVEEWLEKNRQDYSPELYWGYCFGNSWGGFKKYPDDRPAFVEDVRFVIWFDN